MDFPLSERSHKWERALPLKGEGPPLPEGGRGGGASTHNGKRGKWDNGIMGIGGGGERAIYGLMGLLGGAPSIYGLGVCTNAILVVKKRK